MIPIFQIVEAAVGIMSSAWSAGDQAKVAAAEQMVNDAIQHGIATTLGLKPVKSIDDLASDFVILAGKEASMFDIQGAPGAIIAAVAADATQVHNFTAGQAVPFAHITSTVITGFASRAALVAVLEPDGGAHPTPAYDSLYGANP